MLDRGSITGRCLRSEKGRCMSMKKTNRSDKTNRSRKKRKKEMKCRWSYSVVWGRGPLLPLFEHLPAGWRGTSLGVSHVSVDR